jgi:ribosomal protein L37E
MLAPECDQVAVGLCHFSPQSAISSRFSVTLFRDTEAKFPFSNDLRIRPVWLEPCNTTYRTSMEPIMATAGSTAQEYWRPANPHVVQLIESSAKQEACRRCGVEFAPTARFCQACGSPREAGRRLAEGDGALTFSSANSASVRRALSISAILLFVLGVLCIVGAAAIGAIFKADTMSAWEAIQAWRIEWLLAASASFLAGILLKKMD